MTSEVGMAELRPQSTFSPALSTAGSTANLVGSPRPENRPGIKATEILPLLDATKAKRSKEEESANWKKAVTFAKNCLKVS